MEISLDQAIDIYARGLKYRYGGRASHEARTKAHARMKVGDIEGLRVWTRVTEVCEALLTADRPARISEAAE
jgi:hypothetical protein